MLSRRSISVESTYRTLFKDIFLKVKRLTSCEDWMISWYKHRAIRTTDNTSCNSASAGLELGGKIEGAQSRKVSTKVECNVLARFYECDISASGIRIWLLRLTDMKSVRVDWEDSCSKISFKFDRSFQFHDWPDVLPQRGKHCVKSSPTSSLSPSLPFQTRRVRLVVLDWLSGLNISSKERYSSAEENEYLINHVSRGLFK